MSEPNPTRARLTHLKVVGALGAIGLTAHASGVLGALERYSFVVLALGALSANLIAIRRYRPAAAWPWRLIASAMLLFLLGGGLRETYQTLGDLTAGRSLVPDYATFPGYVLIAVGLSGMIKERRRFLEPDYDGMLDGMIASAAALTAAWLYLLSPTLSHIEMPLYVRLSLSIYPPMSALMVSVAVRMLTLRSSARSGIAQRSFVVAMSGLLVGDVVYMLVETHRITLPQRIVDLPYAVAFFVFSLGAMHPSMRTLTEPLRSDEGAPSKARISLVACALAIPAIVTLVQLRSARATDRSVLAILIVVLTGLAVLRVFRALRAHARSEERLGFQATHDLLTGLPNRRFLLEHLPQALRRAHYSRTRIAALFVDLDRFKLINDSGGHGLGDELLKAVAQRIGRNVSEESIVARFGGDEFLVVLPEAPAQEELVALAEGLRLAFDEPFVVAGQEIFISASIGVAVSDGQDDAETLVTNADTAMYQAKESGRDAVSIFDASMRGRLADRVQLEHDLRLAIDRGEFQVYLQPIVRVPDGHVEGFEALLRWFHPTRGQVPPLQFIGIAEDTGRIVEIGRWVIDAACRELARIRSNRRDGEALYVAVNLSVRQLRDPQLKLSIERALTEHMLPASSLCLEITESMLMEDPVSAARMLQSIRETGIRLSLDDFGTGYSSLAYLKRFPVDYVKIDRSFVSELTAEESSDKTLVAAIIAMAHALGITTIAEGVETSEQAQALFELGADRAQGYLFSRPIAPELIAETMDRLNAGAVAALQTALAQLLSGSHTDEREGRPVRRADGVLESLTEK